MVMQFVRQNKNNVIPSKLLTKGSFMALNVDFICLFPATGLFPTC